MQTTTWKDKIMDSSNLWLAALRSEQDERLGEASVLYLRDAADSLERGLPSRAALSASCAADCLERSGYTNAARRLNLEAAKIFEEQAEAAFGRSIREVLWLLQEAHDNYILAGDAQKSAEVYEKCARLAMKSNPFVTPETVDLMLRIRRSTQPRPIAQSVPVPQASEAHGALEDFLRLRDSKAVKVATVAPRSPPSPKNRRRPSSIEKSIVS